MADEADIAEAYIARAIELELHKRQQNTEIKIGPKVCQEKFCGAPIPNERRQLGFQICKECAEEKELADARFANN